MFKKRNKSTLFLRGNKDVFVLETEQGHLVCRVGEPKLTLPPDEATLHHLEDLPPNPVSPSC